MRCSSQKAPGLRRHTANLSIFPPEDLEPNPNLTSILSTRFHKYGHKLWRSEILSFASLEDRLVSTWLRLVLERSEGMTLLSL